MSRSRWIKRAFAGLLALSAAGGCKQQLFMDPGDYHEAVKVALPKSLETNPHSPIVPGTVEKLAPINTVVDFVRPPKHMTLRECIAISLEQGNVGSQSSTQFGFKREDATGSPQSGRLLGGTDAIRAFAVEPAVAYAQIERSLSRFDARWVSVMQWQKLDQPVAAQFLSFQQSRDAAILSSTLAKPLPTGGVVGITASTDYSKFSQQATTQAALVNPNYTPRLQFAIEQPLLRLYGVEINQISNVGPLSEGSQVLQGIRPAGGIGTDGILITRLAFDQAKADFDVKVNFMLANVEAAYWNLYAAYYGLYAQEEGLRQAFDGYRFILIRVLNGSDAPQRLDQIQAQFHRFQGGVYQARGQVLESERQLRGLLGLRSDDGTRIVPIDEPNLAPYKPDFHEAANDAIALRPELMLARQDLKFRQLDLMLQKNLRRPDLRGYAAYDIASLGTRLGGATNDNGPNGSVLPGNAFGGLADNRFNSWTIGFRLDVPLGFRDANGLVRQAQLNMTRSYVQLRDAELKAIEFLSFQYRRVIQTHAQIAPARAERQSLQAFVARLRERIKLGAYTSDEFLNVLTVQQQLAQAIANEASAIASYNTALASFEFAKGTIQQYNNVSVGDGPLPPWVTKRAADHIRERTETAFKLREQPAPAAGPALGGHPVGPASGTNSVLNLPPFAEKQEPLPDALPPRGIDPKNPMVPPIPPAGAGIFRPVPGAPGGAAPRPLPTGVDGDFRPDGRVVVPPRPPGGPIAPTPPIFTGIGDGPGDFKPDGRVTVPPSPHGKLPGTVVTPPGAGATAKPEDIFKQEGTLTIPPARKPGEPVWGPPGPAPAPVQPPGGAVAPVPPIPPLPATLPPLPGGQ